MWGRWPFDCRDNNCKLATGRQLVVNTQPAQLKQPLCHVYSNSAKLISGLGGRCARVAFTKPA